MLNAVLSIDAPVAVRSHVAPRRMSRFLPQEPAQVAYRRLVAALDEEQLVCLESDIEHFLKSGHMSRSLSGMLDAGAEDD